MKRQILALAAVIILSINAFATDKEGQPANATEQKAIARAVLQDTMVHAAVKQWLHLGATCTHEVTSTSSYGNGAEAFAFEMRVDCKMPDNDYFGGGATMYFIKGAFYEKSVLLDSIKIDRAG
jgi:hypothetical protein